MHGLQIRDKKPSQQTKPKPQYIQARIEKAKQREREREVIYERKLATERSLQDDDHLYADKDKLVTRAFKRKLAEKAKWEDEERRRELREARDDVTSKKDMTEFYFDLHKNVAFGGGKEAELSKSKKQHEQPIASEQPFSVEEFRPAAAEQPTVTESQPTAAEQPFSVEEFRPAEQPTVTEQPKKDHHKRSQDALAEAKQRFLTRKRAKVQQSLDASDNK